MKNNLMEIQDLLPDRQVERTECRHGLSIDGVPVNYEDALAALQKGKEPFLRWVELNA